MRFKTSTSAPKIPLRDNDDCGHFWPKVPQFFFFGAHINFWNETNKLQFMSPSDIPNLNKK